MKRAPWIFFLLVGVMSAGAAQAATLVVNDHTFEVSNTLADPTDLWVSPEDFTRINGFVVKPEGACLDEIFEAFVVGRPDSGLQQPPEPSTVTSSA